jgi:hypothetical protein
MALTDAALSATALPAMAESMPMGELTVAAHLRGRSRGTAAGTFVTSGAIEDAGIVHAVERFPVGGDAQVDGAATLTGIRGSLWLVYRGELSPVVPGVLRGCGAWRLAGSDGAYVEIGGEGAWSATVVFAPDGVTTDVVFRGRTTNGR